MKKMLTLRQTHKPSYKLDEHGFASIVIALILIIVLALLTVGFAQLARREQKDALNKQLATQAYYAAEAGINDTVQNLPALELKAQAGTLPPADQCLGPPTTVGPSQNGVQYTCVLVNLKPPSIVYSGIQPETDRYITSSAVSASGGGAVSMTVNWGSTDDSKSFITGSDATNHPFTPANTWNAAKHPALLEFSLTPLAPAGNPNPLSRTSLANNTLTVFLYPVDSGGGTVAYTTVGQAGSTNGSIVSANCDTANGAQYPCRATITGLTGGTGSYLIRVIDHYDPSNVSINGKDAVGNPVGFDGQVQIDATGRAHEVLKRIQVHKSLKASYNIPKDALESQSTCKHFTTDPISDTQTVSLSQDTTGACAFN
jgi:Tfp pilus assembly protein PilX